jgi:hypothetical protein
MSALNKPFSSSHCRGHELLTLPFRLHARPSLSYALSHDCLVRALHRRHLLRLAPLPAYYLRQCLVHLDSPGQGFSQWLMGGSHGPYVLWAPKGGGDAGQLDVVESSLSRRCHASVLWLWMLLWRFEKSAEVCLVFFHVWVIWFLSALILLTLLVTITCDTLKTGLFLVELLNKYMCMYMFWIVSSQQMHNLQMCSSVLWVAFSLFIVYFDTQKLSGWWSRLSVFLWLSVLLVS